MTEKHENNLIRERSPYLLQHAHNPVDWYPWGDEAFGKAKHDDKPVFLSIGYSTCHWCHVMEKESFEDESVAAVLNRIFVSVKVDREERPDLDRHFMSICERMTGSGGWPLTIIMTPDREVFFAGTYIPKECNFGHPGLVELAEQVEDIWRNRRSDIESLAEQVKASLTPSAEASDEALGKEILDDGYEKLALSFDDRYGGWSRGLKFPSAGNILFLLRYGRRHKQSSALKMVEKTLQSMRAGGVFDQIGFGFHRYATDEEWILPHFEKMLYDQALMALAYTEAHQATGKQDYRRTAEEILEYVLRNLRSPEDCFYSAQDADSEGTEGKFYVWTFDEIGAVLNAEDAGFAIRVFGVTKNGNFRIETPNGIVNANVLHMVERRENMASALGLSVKEFDKRMERVRRQLFSFREKRTNPAVDNKILTDWNGLAIVALARAYQVFEERKYLEAAVNAAEFVLTRMRNEYGELLHVFTKGEVSIQGFLDDYAFFAWGLIEVYEAGFDARFLRHARNIIKVMWNRFWDDEKGGFFSVARGHIEKGLQTVKESSDGAVPSGNAIALLCLLHLSRLTGDVTLEQMAAKLGRAFSLNIQRVPEAHAFMLVGVDFIVGPAYVVVLVGDLEKEDMKVLLGLFKRVFTPNTVILFKPSDEMSEDLLDVFPWAMIYEEIANKATAYLCRNQKCLLPTNDATKIMEKLEEEND